MRLGYFDWEHLPLNFKKLKWLRGWSHESISFAIRSYREIRLAAPERKQKLSLLFQWALGNGSPGVHLLVKPELCAERHAAMAPSYNDTKSLAKIWQKCLLQLLAVQPQQRGHHWAVTSVNEGSNRKMPGRRIWGMRYVLWQHGPSSPCQWSANMDISGQCFPARAKLFSGRLIWWAQSSSDPSQLIDAFKLN